MPGSSKCAGGHRASNTRVAGAARRGGWQAGGAPDASRACVLCLLRPQKALVARAPARASCRSAWGCLHGGEQAAGSAVLRLAVAAAARPECEDALWVLRPLSKNEPIPVSQLLGSHDWVFGARDGLDLRWGGISARRAELAAGRHSSAAAPLSHAGSLEAWGCCQLALARISGGSVSATCRGQQAGRRLGGCATRRAQRGSVLNRCSY